MRRAVLLVIVAALLVAVAGCGSSSGGSDGAGATTTTRAEGGELTDDDAERVAQMLFKNYQAGGASVSASVDYSDQFSVAIDGTVDWKGHRGALTVTTTFADGSPQDVQEVVFTEDTVFTKTAEGQAAELDALGYPGVEWLSRPPDPEGHPLDQVIELLVSLAATRPDNPQLVLQGETEFDRSEEVDGTPADAYTSPTATYWLDAGSGQMLRFQGTLEGFSGPVVVDLSDQGPVVVEVPEGDGVLSEAELTGSG